MATYSTVAIANRALLLCGASPITALSDDTPNGRAMNEIYDPARKNHLTECKWTFSVTRTTMATVSTTTFAWLHPEEGYAYDRPTDALRVWAMSDIYAIWREEGDHIFSDTVGLGLLYTYDHTDESKWRPKFVMAFIDLLASEVAFNILNHAKKAEAFLAKYETISLPKAMTENSQTGLQNEVIDDEWTASKFSNGGNPSRSYG